MNTNGKYYTVPIVKMLGAQRFDVDYFRPEFLDLDERLASLPETASLGTLADVEYGFMPTEDYANVETGVPLIRVTNIKPDATIDMSDVKYIRAESHRLQDKLVCHRDILMVQCGNTTGKVAMVPKELEGYAFASFCFRIRPTTDRVTPEYLFAVLHSAVGFRQVWRSITYATVRPNTTKPYVQAIRVPLYSSMMQDRIAQVMQDAYAARRAKLAKAKAMYDGIEGFLLGSLGIDIHPAIHRLQFVIKSRKLVGDRFDVDFHLPHTGLLYTTLESTRACEVVSLGSLTRQIANGATPKGANYLSEGIPFFRIQNVTPEGVDMSDVRYISRATHNEMRRSQTTPGDLLMTITGRVGTAARIPDTVKEGNINQHLVILRLKPESVDADYLAAIINSAAVSFQIQHRTTGTTRIALDYKAIRALMIPLPSFEKQRELASEVSKRRGEAARLRVEADTLVAQAKARIERMILGEESVT